MSSLNTVFLIGRLGKDPDLRYGQDGTPFCRLSVATDESYKNREGEKVERTEWHSVIVFHRSAENCKTCLSKGSLIFIEGALQTRKWQSQDGQERYTTEVKARRVQFLDRKGAQAPAAQPGQEQQEPDYGPAYPSEASGMDSVPF